MDYSKMSWRELFDEAKGRSLDRGPHPSTESLVALLEADDAAKKAAVEDGPTDEGNSGLVAEVVTQDTHLKPVSSEVERLAVQIGEEVGGLSARVETLEELVAEMPSTVERIAAFTEQVRASEEASLKKIEAAREAAMKEIVEKSLGREPAEESEKPKGLKGLAAGLFGRQKKGEVTL